MTNARVFHNNERTPLACTRFTGADDEVHSDFESFSNMFYSVYF